jgi:hypothetical protein
MHWCGKGEAPGPIGPTGPQEKASRHVAPSPTSWCVCVCFLFFCLMMMKKRASRRSANAKCS